MAPTQRGGMKHTMAETSPNLLFVFSDQHRRCDLGCYGNPQVRTPNLDRLASQARRFEHCVSNAPVCVPMRGTMLTGRHAWRHRAITNDLPVDTRVPSIADALNVAGYHTGYIGKWHLGGIPRDQAILPGARLGFTEWKVAECNHTYDQGYYFDEQCRRHAIPGFQSVGETDLAVDFIRRAAGKPQPWALFLSWSPPHNPYDAIPQEYLAQYDAGALALRPNVPDGFPQAADLLRCYYALITLLDEQFGRLTTALEETGQRERTVVVYTSDHGDMLGSQGFLNKQLPFEESIGVPLIVSWPGHLPPGVEERPLGLVDLPVTLAAAMGCPMTDVDGRDARQANDDDAQLIYDLVPCHQAAERNGHEWMGLRTSRWTYARQSNGKCDVLFDNAQDPFQLHNLATAPEATDIRASLESRLALMLDACGYSFRPWQQMVREDGYLREWNRSQAYFGLPTLEP